jgi:hypothetical protein
VTPTSFNMAESITQSGATLGFTYGSGHDRILMMGPSGTTTYLNDPGGMSEQLVNGSAVTWHDYIVSDDGQVIAEHFIGAGTPPAWGAVTWGNFNWSNATSAMLYFSSDSLGSIAVIANAAGSVIERDSYDVGDSATPFSMTA